MFFESLPRQSCSQVETALGLRALHQRAQRESIVSKVISNCAVAVRLGYNALRAARFRSLLPLAKCATPLADRDVEGLGKQSKYIHTSLSGEQRVSGSLSNTSDGKVYYASTTLVIQTQMGRGVCGASGQVSWSLRG